MTNLSRMPERNGEDVRENGGNQELILTMNNTASLNRKSVIKFVVLRHLRHLKLSYYDNKLNNCSVKDMFKTINEFLHTSNKAIIYSMSGGSSQ